MESYDYLQNLDRHSIVMDKTWDLKLIQSYYFMDLINMLPQPEPEFIFIYAIVSYLYYLWL